MSSTSGGRKHTDSANRDFHAAINMRRCAVLKTRPPELTRSSIVEQSPTVDVYKEKSKPIASALSKKGCEASLSAYPCAVSSRTHLRCVQHRCRCSSLRTPRAAAGRCSVAPRRCSICNLVPTASAGVYQTPISVDWWASYVSHASPKAKILALECK